MTHCRKNSSVSCPHRNEMPNNMALENWIPDIHNDLTLVMAEAEKEKEIFCTFCIF